jgi:hypothetical protein
MMVNEESNSTCPLAKLMLNSFEAKLRCGAMHESPAVGFLAIAHVAHA